MIQAAPYPADTKAKGWRFELDLEKVRQSDTWALAGPSLRPWLLLIWAVAWEQVPCGSLPNDDELISARLEMPVDEFRAGRSKLLRGWWAAEDGRLYHDTITAQVLAMLTKRRSDAGRMARSRAGRADATVTTGNDGGCHADVAAGHAHVTRDKGVSHYGVASEFDTGTGTSITSSLRSEVKPAKRAGKPRLTLNADDLVAEGADPAHARDWLKVRKVALTRTAWDGIKARGATVGLGPADIVMVCAKAEWRSFEPDWKWQKHLPGRTPSPAGTLAGKDYSRGVDGDGHLQ